MKNSVGILVFTGSKNVLEHKKRDGKHSEGNYCYWETGKLPKRFTHYVECRIYFAVKRQVKGYFVIDSSEIVIPEDEDDVKKWRLCFDSESWTPIEDGETLNHSQGWRYYLH